MKLPVNASTGNTSNNSHVTHISSTVCYSFFNKVYNLISIIKQLESNSMSFIAKESKENADLVLGKTLS